MIGNAELIAIVGLGVMLFVSGVGAAYALGNLPRRSEFKDANEKNEASHKELSGKIDGVQKELTDKIDGVQKELTDKIDGVQKELTDKIEQSNASLTVEIQRSHQRVMRALVNHRHLEPDGEPIFTEPSDSELIAADN